MFSSNHFDDFLTRPSPPPIPLSLTTVAWSGSAKFVSVGSVLRLQKLYPNKHAFCHDRRCNVRPFQSLGIDLRP